MGHGPNRALRRDKVEGGDKGETCSIIPPCPPCPPCLLVSPAPLPSACSQLSLYGKEHFVC